FRSDPDVTGHESGWMSEEYGEAVTATDATLRRLVAAASSAFDPSRFTVIVTADHGGHERDHDSDDPRDTTIPWVAWGEGVQAGTIGGAVHTVDTASTVLRLLGVRPPSDAEGHPVASAVAPEATVPAIASA